MTTRRVFALVPCTILALAFANLQVPYYSIAPGPAQDVKPLLVLSGTKTYPSKGKLLLTTVRLQSLRVADVVTGWADPSVDVVPRSQIVPPQTDQHEVDRINAQQMEDSKRDAATAAARFLGLPVRISGTGARIERVFKGTPADGVLRADDVVLEIDGISIDSKEALVSEVQRRKIGATIGLRVRRDGAPTDVRLRTARSADSPPRPIIGVLLLTESEHVDLPFGLDIRSQGIGGPSAGLMFALGVVDLLQPGDLTNGAEIAGTGVISPSGEVGPVGGVAQKVAAARRAKATVFLVPAEELKDAKKAAHGLKIIGVRDLADAVRVLGELQRPVRASHGSSD